MASLQRLPCRMQRKTGQRLRRRVPSSAPLRYRRTPCTGSWTSTQARLSLRKGRRKKVPFGRHRLATGLGYPGAGKTAVRSTAHWPCPTPCPRGPIDCLANARNPPLAPSGTCLPCEPGLSPPFALDDFLVAQGRTKSKENYLDDVFGEHWKPGHKSSPYIPALKEVGLNLLTLTSS